MKGFSKKKVWMTLSCILACVLLFSMTVFAADGDVQQPQMYATFWALVPPIVAIVLALITKEVYSSLFIGIIVGGLFYSGFSFEGTVLHILDGGIITVLSDKTNVGIIIFLVILGAMVSLMNRAGGSAAFGEWAGKHIKTRVGAQLATMVLGILIFVDDYFNCLTVGSVMRPITDKHNVSRAKLAYIIDSTAAPICIIAPISSWAAAVTSCVDSGDGFSIFIHAIPFNFYALLTVVMMLGLIFMKVDFGSMKKHEINAMNGDIYTTPDRPFKNSESDDTNKKGKVIDLVVPILALIICCVLCMLYTGGFFSGTNFVEAFSNSDASLGLSMGSIFALLITIIFYLVRRVLSFEDCMDSIPEGFKAMVPAIIILTFAWTLKAMTESLGAAAYVEGIVRNFAGSMMNLLPAIIFLIGCLLAFAIGTSWGTFGILIPIVVDAFANDPALMIVAISACMAGAVCGDHCSPISDTTIMASAGAQSNHVNHVSTQIPYAVTVAAVSFVTYIIAGFTRSAWISLPIGIVLILIVLVAIKKIQKNKN